MKRFLALVLATVMITALAACNSKPSTPTPSSAAPSTASSTAGDSSTPAAKEKVTLRFYNYALSETSKAAWWENVIKDFESKNAWVDIETVAVDYNSMVTTITNDLAAGLPIDLIYGTPAWIPSLVEGGFLAEPTNVLTPDFYSGYYSNVLEQFQYKDKIYGVPHYYSNAVMFVNKDLVEAAGLSMDKFPTTLDDLKKWVEQLGTFYKGNTNVSTILGLTTAEVPASGYTINCLYTAFGGTLINKDGTLADLNSEPNKTAMTETLDLHKYLLDKGYTQENLKLKDYRASFGAGNVCMYVDSSWGYAQIGEVDPNASKFTVTAPLPTTMGKNGKGNSIVESHAFLFGNGMTDAQKEATDLFIQYCTTTSTMEKYLNEIAPAFVAHKNMADCKLPAMLQGAAAGVNQVVYQPMIAPIVSVQTQLATTVLDYCKNGVSVDDAIKNYIKQADYYINQ